VLPGEALARGAVPKRALFMGVLARGALFMGVLARGALFMGVLARGVLLRAPQSGRWCWVGAELPGLPGRLGCWPGWLTMAST
jgi:hypothetical protein